MQHREEESEVDLVTNHNHLNFSGFKLNFQEFNCNKLISRILEFVLMSVISQATLSFDV